MILGSWGGRGEEDQRACLEAWRQPASFSPLTLAVKRKKNQTSSTASVNLMPELTQLLETHSTESVSVSFPVLNYVNKPRFLIPCSIQFLFLDQ